MSGRGNISYKRTNSSDSALLTQGAKTLVFAHSASAGETGINFSALNWSAQDQADSGIVNPTAAEILASNLMFYKSNIEILSSAKNTLAPTSYRVTNGAIVWNGWTASQDEKFFIKVNNVVRSANSFADAQPLYESGIIAEGNTEFDFIRQVKIPSDTSYQPILVSIDGATVDPNTGNSSVVTDGMYYIKDLGNGYGRSIKLNAPAPVGGYQVQVWGMLVYKPDNSLLQQVQTIGGQLDTIIADLAYTTGNPESRYRTAVNDVDLAYFSNTVQDIKRSLSPVGTVISSFLSETDFTNEIQSTTTFQWVPCDGRSVVGSRYATIKGTGVAPDLRGNFLRGNDNGRGVDTGRTLGSAQLDQSQGHSHGRSGNHLGTRSGTSGGAEFTADSSLAIDTYQVVTDGINGTPRVGSETRPVNTSVNFYLRIN